MYYGMNPVCREDDCRNQHYYEKAFAFFRNNINYGCFQEFVGISRENVFEKPDHFLLEIRNRHKRYESEQKYRSRQ